MSRNKMRKSPLDMTKPRQRKKKAAATSGGGIKEFANDLKRSIRTLDEKIDNAAIAATATGTGKRIARKLLRRPKKKSGTATSGIIPIVRGGGSVTVDHEAGTSTVKNPVKKGMKKQRMKTYKGRKKRYGEK